MARKSSLSDKQWAEIEKRLLSGEGARALSREYKVPESTIRTRLSAQTAQIKSVAQQVITAENAFNELNYSAQVSAQALINDLRAISTHLAGAGRLGAMTSHQLHAIANLQVAKINKDDPMESQEVLQGISSLTKMANESSSIGLSLISSNKEMLKDFGREKSNEKDITPTNADEAREAYELITRRRNV